MAGVEKGWEVTCMTWRPRCSAKVQKTMSPVAEESEWKAKQTIKLVHGPNPIFRAVIVTSLSQTPTLTITKQLVL